MIGLRLWLAWLLVVGTVVFNAAAWAASDFVVTLLGTASPAPRAGRMGPSTLVVVNGQRLLFDAGRNRKRSVQFASRRNGQCARFIHIQQ